MIYYFDSTGKVVFKSDAVKSRITDAVQINRYFEHFKETMDCTDWVVSSFDYDIDEIYYTRGGIAMRPALPVVQNGFVLSEIPMPSVITINGVPHQNNADVVEFVFDFPGVYIVRVSAWPYLDRQFKMRKE